MIMHPVLNVVYPLHVHAAVVSKHWRDILITRDLKEMGGAFYDRRPV